MLSSRKEREREDFTRSRLTASKNLKAGGQRGCQRTMLRCSLLSLLVLLIFLCFFESTTAMATLPRRPGFLYTRRRGRCTPRYWASRTDEWPRMVPQGSTVAKAFGSVVAFERYRSDLTLLEAASRNDDVTDAYVQLAKQASAALLNSYARKGYPFTAWEVKTLLILGLVSEETAVHQAQLLMKANEDCN